MQMWNKPMQMLLHLRLNTQNTPFEYLNIINPRNKLIDSRIVMFHLLIDHFVISKTNLDDSFLPCILVDK